MKPYYQDSAVTIYHGDCRDTFIRREIAEVGDVLITDPPYGVRFNGKYNTNTGGYVSGDSDIGPIVVTEYLKLCDRGVVFTGNRLLQRYPVSRDVGGIYSPAGAGVGPWGFICFHVILFYGARPGGPKSPSTIRSSAISELCDHPCPKPIEWMKWAVTIGSIEGETVVDPFMGSGTTLRAAKDLGRKAIGIEIEERYCEIAARRMAQEVLFTGDAA